MDVLQKWNRSIPDGNGTAAAVLFFLLFIFLKQFYLFPSGGMEAADVCLFASFFMLLCDCMRRRPERLFQLKTEGLFYVFLAFVLVINTYYGIRLGRGEFSKYTCFWIFNACAIWSFCYLAEYGGKAFLTGINRVVKVNIGVQLLIYLTGRGRIFREYWGAVRYQGTFNDPNQLAFFLFMMILLLYLYPVPVWGSELSCVLCAGTAGDCGIEVYGNFAGSFDFYGSGCFGCPVPGGMQKRCVYESVDSGNRHRSGSVWPVLWW